MFAEEIEPNDFSITMPDSVVFDDAPNQSFDNEQNVNTDDNKTSPVKTDENDPESESQVSSKGEENTSGPKMIEFRENVILKNLAESFKETGIEIDVSDDEKSTDFIKKVTSSISEKIISDPESDIYKQLKNSILEENGIDDKILSVATGIAYGVDRNEYLDLISTKEFASYDFSLNDEQSLAGLFTTYHLIKGISEEDIERYVHMDIQNADESLVEERRASVYNYAENGLKNIESKIIERKNIARERQNEKVTMMNEFVTKGEVDGYSFTKDEFDAFVKGTTVKDQEIELPGGVKQKVTAFEKKKYEHINQNFSKAVLDDMLFFLEKENTTKKKNADTKERKETGVFMKGLHDDFSERGYGNYAENKIQQENVDFIVSMDV